MANDVKAYATGRAAYNRYRQGQTDKGQPVKSYSKWSQSPKTLKGDETYRRYESGRYD